MKKKIINLLALFVILAGGLYLSQPVDAAESYSSCFNECLLFNSLECTFCWRVCTIPHGDTCWKCYGERCDDGGEHQNELRAFNPPIDDPCRECL